MIGNKQLFFIYFFKPSKRQQFITYHHINNSKTWVAHTSLSSFTHVFVCLFFSSLSFNAQKTYMATFLGTSADGASSRILTVGRASLSMNSATRLCLTEEYNGQWNRKCVSSSRLPGQNSSAVFANNVFKPNAWELRGLPLGAVARVAVASCRESVDEEGATAPYSDARHDIVTALRSGAAATACCRLLPLLRQAASLQVQPEGGCGAAAVTL